MAELYQCLAVDLNMGKEEYFVKREEIIRTYKEQGRKGRDSGDAQSHGEGVGE